MKDDILKKIVLSCALLTMCWGAHAASLNIGYCYGEISEEGFSKVGKATVEGAIVLPGELLASYAGATVTGIRIGLVTANGVGNLSGWVRESLEGDNLDSGEIESAADGWNEVSLAGGIMLDGSPLVAGFSFTQEKAVKCLSIVGEDYEGGRWVAKNGKWEQAKKRGVLSIELVVTSESLPSTDLSVVSLSGPDMPVRAGEDMEFNVRVRNVALSDINGFDVEYSVAGMETWRIHEDVTLAYGEMVEATFTLDASGLEPDKAHLMEVRVICEGDDSVENNVAQCPVGVYTQSLERRVLVEEFTTELCGNCPRAINTLRQCEENGYGERMSLVAHHVGYYTDWLTMPGDEEYLWFYDPAGESGTFAPAVMLDRTALSGEAVPVSSIGYYSDFEPVLANATEVPAFVSLDVSGECDGDSSSEIDISVEIERLQVFEAVSPSPRLTVYIVEDGIPHHSQAGITSDTFTHSHVLRRNVTDIWGVPVTWDGDRSVMSFTVPVESGWNPENIGIVAFIHDYNPDDVTDCRVHNSSVAHIGNSGVHAISAPDVETESWHTLSGMCVGKPDNGLFVRKRVFSDGSVRYDKIYERGIR